METRTKSPGQTWTGRVKAIRLGRPGGRTRRWASIGWQSLRNLANGGTDRAAAMAYYAIQSLFPGLLVVVLLALLLSSASTVNSAVDWFVRNGLDPKLADSLNTTLQGAAAKASGGVGFAVIVAAATSISSASGWLAACGRAIEPDSNHRRSRGPIGGRLRFSLWTLVLLSLLVIALAALATGGGVADTIFGWVGFKDGAPFVWQVLRPILVIAGIVIAMWLLYRVAPDRITSPPWRELFPGAVVAGIGWVVASGAFAFYVQNLASLGATYGTFATPIVLLIWLWLSGVVVLLGAEVNAEIGRRRHGRHWPVRIEGADTPEISGHPLAVMPDESDDEALRAHDDDALAAHDSD